MAKNEQVDSGTYQDGYWNRSFTRTAKTVRNKTTFTYAVKDERTLFEADVEDFIAQLRTEAEGLDGAYVTLVSEPGMYSDGETRRMVVSGYRPATEEEEQAIEASIQKEYDRVQRMNAQREENLIKQLRELRPDLIIKEGDA